MEHDGCVGCKYEMYDLDSKECSGCKQNAIDKYTRMTNRESILEQFTNDDYKLAKALIEVSIEDDGDWGFDENNERYWKNEFVVKYTCPTGSSYDEFDYEECLRETVEWLGKKVDVK